VTRAMGAAMRRIHVGNALSAFGLGFTVPYLYVYVAQVRGLGPMTAGMVLAVFAVAALIVLPLAGRAIVRRGALPVLLAALLTAAIGSLSLGLSANAATVLLSAAALGAGQAVMQPALATMIVDCSGPETRSRAFAMQFFLQNLGLGVGGLIGGHLVDPTKAGSFTLLFAIEAVMFLLLVAVMSTVRMPRSPRIDGTPAQSATGPWCSCACWASCCSSPATASSSRA
jgi:MFS family permease